MNKKEQIYKSAIELFNLNGFDKTPTSQIAKEANVAIGTLFHHFKTKEDLINSLYLKCKESMIKRTVSGVEDESTYKGKIRRLYLNFLHWGVDYENEFLFFQQFSNSKYILEITKVEGKNKFEILLNIFKEGMEKEILKKLLPDYFLAMSSAIMMSNINYFILNKHLINDEVFIEETFDFLWNSIRN